MPLSRPRLSGKTLSIFIVTVASALLSACQGPSIKGQNSNLLVGSTHKNAGEDTTNSTPEPSSNVAAGKPKADAAPDCTLGGLSPKRISEGSVDWGQLYEDCPGSAVAAYNYGLALVESGQISQARELIEQALNQHGNFAPLGELKTQLVSPFARVAERANEKLQAWMQRPSTVPEFNRSVPEKQELPPLPKLVKGEFETSKMFKQRVAQARSERARKIEAIEAEYQREVEAFNQAVTDYNAALDQEEARRQARIPEMKRYFLSEAMGEVFGKPRFVDPQYDADRGLFNARLVSAKGNFDKRVAIQVPLSKARRFKEQINQVNPALTFDVVNDRIRLEKIEAQLDSQNYVADLTEEVYESQPVSVQLAERELPRSNSLSLISPEELNTQQLLAENSEHFQGALQFEDDPELARQRQELAELERKKREARLRSLKEEERKRLQAQIERNRQELASMGGQAAEEYKGLKMTTAWRFKPARAPQDDMLAVVIGNRNYGTGIPLVHYAHNDAKAVKQFLTNSYGVAPENILYEEDATKGVMDGIFRQTLRNRVTPGKTDLFVYYSGHGMPVDRDARLLPSDARPETAEVTGYSRDEMLQQLASLDANSLTVVLDACYSGSAKSGRSLQSVKAILAEPKRVQAPKGAVIISAASGKQTAFMDDKTGHSLLTYHLLKGLSGNADGNADKRVDTRELEAYLVGTVNRSALRLHNQPQQPEIKGPDRSLIQY